MRSTDHEQVKALLGRDPQGAYEVVVRSPDGTPRVIRNAPFLNDGTPMPTLYWLLNPTDVLRVSRLESNRGVHLAEDAVDSEELAEAHRCYAAERDLAIPETYEGHRPYGGVGGTRQGVKCLHAHYAWHLAGGADPVGRWVAEQLAAICKIES